MEHHVQQYEDHKKDDGQDQREALPRTEFELVFARTRVRVAGRERELLAERLRGPLSEPTVIRCIQIDVDASREQAVLVADHGWKSLATFLPGGSAGRRRGTRGCSSFAATGRLSLRHAARHDARAAAGAGCRTGDARAVRLHCPTPSIRRTIACKVPAATR